MNIYNLIYTLLDIIHRKGIRATVKIAYDRVFEEEDVKRDKNGRFATKGGTSTKETKSKAKHGTLSKARPTGLAKRHNKISLDDASIDFIDKRYGTFTYNKKKGVLLQNRHAANSPDDKEALAFYEKIIPADERTAIGDFIADMGFCSKMRAAQRGEIDDPVYVEGAKAAERGLRHAPHWNNPEPIYRGITINPEQYEAIKEPGSDIPLGGFSSWSTKMNVASGFAQSKHQHAQPNEYVEVILQSSEPFKVAADIQPFSKKYFRQYEVGVSCDTRIKNGKIIEETINPITNRRQVRIEVEEYD